MLKSINRIICFIREVFRTVIQGEWISGHNFYDVSKTHIVCDSCGEINEITINGQYNIWRCKDCNITQIEKVKIECSTCGYKSE